MFYILLCLPLLTQSLNPISSQLLLAKSSPVKSIFDFSNHPSEIIKQFYGTTIGTDWTYSEFLNNVENNKVGAVSFISDGKHAIAIDNILSDDKIQSTNLHSIQILPDTYNTLVETVSGKHINVDLIQIPENPFATFFNAVGSGAFQVGMFFVMYFIIANIIRGVFFGGENMDIEGENKRGNLEKDFQRMMAFSMTTSNDTLLASRGGMLSSNLIKYNIFHKNYEKYTFNYFDNFEDHSRIDENN